MSLLRGLSAAAICVACLGAADAQQVDQPSAWRVEDKVDKLDGDRIVTLYVLSTDFLEQNGRKTSPAVLAIRCSNRRTDITIHWPVYLGNAGSANVRWRVDGGDIADDAWSVDRQATNQITHSQGLKYVKQWFGKKTLIFSVIHPRAPQTLTFPIAGLEAARSIMKTLCDW